MNMNRTYFGKLFEGSKMALKLLLFVAVIGFPIYAFFDFFSGLKGKDFWIAAFVLVMTLLISCLAIYKSHTDKK